MRPIFVFSFLLILAACGKESGGRGKSTDGTGTTTTTSVDGCKLNGRSVACESIRGADGLGVDLLESMVDVPIQVTDTSITFMSDKTSNSQGRRIDCPTMVKEGETISYEVQGDSLHITTSDGKFTYQRLNASEGLTGSWMWKGYEGIGQHIIRQLSFLSKTRVIMRTSCEI